MRSALIVMLLLAVLITVTPVLAAETITKDNFAEPVIEPKLKDYYFPGDAISFNLTIEPKTSDDAELIDGRIYEFNTSLENSLIRVMVEYKDGGAITQQGGSYVKADVGDWDFGLDRIKVEVSGTVPEVNSRIQNVVVLGIDIQDAESNAVPPVVIKVVNKGLFNSYIQQLENRYSELEGKASSLEDRGAKVGEIKSKLNSAKAKLDEGKDYFSNGKYGDANTTLGEAENLLNEAQNMLRKVEVELLRDVVSQKLDIMLEKMTGLEIRIQQLKSRGEQTLDYEIKLEEFKRSYSDLKARLSQADDYLSNNLYDDAETTLEKVKTDVDMEIDAINSLISQLPVEETPTSTPAATPTPQPEGPSISEQIGEWFSGISGWLSENSGRILMYGGGAVVLIAAGFAGYKGFKKYMKKRKWDELK
ncbi:hypothetical protein [Geoglobus acetivorans]|uniref:Uncharacterized protein n=1 Tax=Geoglobus acetivorans TaxID=565033 RepID=A0A0A7GEW0_GEOAI|nr:hypothetical protein GACE_1544 [Geoglobus acetivorans]